MIWHARREIGVDVSEKQFALQYNLIDQNLSDIPKIKIAWAEFTETLIKPKIDENRNVIDYCANTDRPEDYFNLHDLGMGPDFLKVWPAIFVGVGLSFTFFGLIAALDQAVNAIEQPGLGGTPDSAIVQGAIGNLLRISSAKIFRILICVSYVSLHNIIGAIFRLVDFGDSLKKFNQVLEKGVNHLTTERLTQTSNQLLSDQLLQLKTFNTDLAMKIGQEVQSSLDATMKPVIEKLDSMGADLTKQNISAIEDIANKVADTIHGSTAGSMDRVAAILDEVSSKLGNLTETLSSALGNFDTEFKAMLSKLKDSLQETTDGVGSAIADSMKNMQEGIGESSGHVENILGGLNSSVEALANTGSDIAKRGAEEIRVQVEEAAKEVSTQMALAGSSLSKGFQSSTEELVSALTNAGSSLKILEQGLTGLPDRFSEVNSQLTQSASSISQASTQFTTASGGLKELVAPLAEYASETREAILEITNSLAEIGEKKSAMQVKVLKNSTNSLNNEVGAQLARLDGSDEKLAGLLQGIEQSTTKTLQSISNYTVEIDTGFNNSLGMLKEKP